MRRGCWLVVITAAALIFGGRPAYCWDKYGHILAAEIAYENLTPAARTHVDALLKVLQTDPHVSGLETKYQPYNAVTVAAWMDDMRMNRQDTGHGHTSDFNTWHYVDLPDGPLTVAQIAAGFANDADPNCYGILVHKCLPALKKASTPLADQARYLAMFFHLAGDIHQPLHCIGRQKGGNEYQITPLPDYSAGPDAWHITNLHAFWDNAYRYDGVAGKIVAICPISDQPRSMTPGTGDIRNIADGLILPFIPKDAAQVAVTDPAVWARESHDIATSFAFPTGSPSTLTADYVHQAHVIACTRLALAGMRMAEVLNAAYQ